MATKKNRTTEAPVTHVELMPEDSDELITLQDDNGNDVDFYQVACVELEGEFYALLQPVETIEGVADDEVLIFKLIEEDEETDMFVPVEDEELLDRVFGEYLKAAADSDTKAEEDAE